MTATILKPQVRQALLKNLRAKQSSKNKLLQEGFTLVELMIVIVIVGILSAVALPNFLNQTNKAKGTEAKTKLTALLKEAHAEFQMTGNVAATTTAIAPSITSANAAGKFDYAISVADPVITGTGTGDGNADANLADVVYNGCVNIDTGAVAVGTNPGQAVFCT
jgi:type IV pilus assembly protein PilA